MAKLTIRVDLDDKTAFGPGKAKLLEVLDREGSIRRAAVAMDMSYRRAWLLVQDIEAAMGKPVVVAKTGGTGGGGVTLTELGRNLLARYRTIERHAGRAVAAELRALARLRARTSEVSGGSKRRSLRRH